MLLTVDIGNTNISFGVFEGSRIIKIFSTPTRNYRLQIIRKKLGRVSIDDAIVCSVVPNIGKEIEKDLTQLLGKRPYIIGKDIKVPIKNLYRKPSQVGQDRLVNAYAAVKLYGSPLIVVDFGTAITFDVVSKKKEYLGGLILPGLDISLDVLAERTALLPKIQLSKPREFIGRNTKSSMLSGIIYGFASLTDNLATRIKNKIGKNARFIGTGGNISLIGRYCKKLNKIDRDLTLKGLNLIYQREEKLLRH